MHRGPRHARCATRRAMAIGVRRSFGSTRASSPQRRARRSTSPLGGRSRALDGQARERSDRARRVPAIHGRRRAADRPARLGRARRCGWVKGRCGSRSLLPRIDALVACDAAHIVNRYVRPLLRALAKCGALAHFFGRDWVSVGHRPAAWVGFAHDRESGRAVVESFVARETPFDLAPRASYLGKEPGTLASIVGRAIDEARLADAIAARLRGRVRARHGRSGAAAGGRWRRRRGRAARGSAMGRRRRRGDRTARRRPRRAGTVPRRRRSARLARRARLARSLARGGARRRGGRSGGRRARGAAGSRSTG